MADYGIKVTKAGYNIASATDDQLIMSSEFNMLKTKATGTFTGAGNVAHGLSYVPIFLAFAKGGTLDRMALSGSGGVDSTNLTFTGSTIKRYYIFYQQSI